MFEQQHILDKIERWAEKLPYRTLKIEIELPGQTLTLEKNKVRPIGFTNMQKEVRKNGCAQPEK